MTIEEVKPIRLGPVGAQILGWGAMGIASVAALVVSIARQDPITDLLAILAVVGAIVVVAAIVAAPEAFEHTYPRMGDNRMINIALIAPATILLILALNANMARPDVGWLIAGGGAALALLAGIWAPMRPALKSPLVMLGFLIGYGAMAGWGAAVMLDTRLDHAPGMQFQAPIERIGMSYGRRRSRTSYYVLLGAAGPLADNTRMGVSRDTYQALQQGGRACVTAHPGALGLAWYSVAAC
jgi:hypothetical protein